MRDKESPLLIGERLKGHERVVTALTQSLPQPVFHGKMAVCLTTRPFRLIKDGHISKEMPELTRKNREDWMRTYPNALFCEVDSYHEDACNENNMRILYHTLTTNHWLDEETETNAKS